MTPFMIQVGCIIEYPVGFFKKKTKVAYSDYFNIYIMQQYFITVYNT